MTRPLEVGESTLQAGALALGARRGVGQPGGFPQPPSGMIRVTGPRGLTVVLIVMGDPDRSGGVGGWEQSERMGRVAADWWKMPGKPTASWPLLLDADALPGEKSVDDRLRTLYLLGQKHRDDPPPGVRLSGDVPAQDRRITWKIDDITLGARLYEPGFERALRRVAVTLAVSSLNDVDVLEEVSVRPTRGRGGKRRARQVRATAGDTLRGIAVRELGSSGEWAKLREWNPRLKKVDPDEPLRRGTRVALKG